LIAFFAILIVGVLSAAAQLAEMDLLDQENVTREYDSKYGT
jgi:hypothetical protein